MLVKHLPLPFSDYDFVFEAKYVTIVTNEYENLFHSSLNEIIKASIYHDDYYYEADECDESEEIGHFYLDIKYIREVRLQDVVEGEWSMCFGPQSLEQYLENNEDIQADSIVKVLGLQPLNYDLKQLRKAISSTVNQSGYRD